MTTARRLLIALLATCLCAVAPAGVALADGEDVLRDCNDNGKLDKGYSQGDLRDAIENIPTDLDEYTDCRDVIRRAQLGLGGSSGGSGSGGGTAGAGAGSGAGGASSGGGGAASGGSSANATEALANATPQEKAALAQTTAEGGSAPVRIGGALIGPRVGVASSTSLPTPLIVVLVLLSVVGLASVGLRVTKLVGTGRS